MVGQGSHNSRHIFHYFIFYDIKSVLGQRIIVESDKSTIIISILQQIDNYHR